MVVHSSTFVGFRGEKYTISQTIRSSIDKRNMGGKKNDEKQTKLHHAV
jgi:hypothetical protein